MALAVVASSNLGADFDVGSRTSGKINVSWAISPTWTGTHAFIAAVSFNASINVTGTAALSSVTMGSSAGTAGTTNKIALYSNAYGFGISPSSIDYVSSANHTFYVNSSSVGAITSSGLNGMAIGATTPSAGTFTTLKGTTPATTDNSVNAATTAFVVALLSNSAALGALLATLPTTAPSSAGQAWIDNGAVRVS